MIADAHITHTLMERNEPNQAPKKIQTDIKSRLKVPGRLLMLVRKVNSSKFNCRFLPH